MKKWRERREDIKREYEVEATEREKGRNRLFVNREARPARRAEFPCAFTSRCVSTADNPSDNSSIDSCKFVIGARNVSYCRF